MSSSASAIGGGRQGSLAKRRRRQIVAALVLLVLIPVLVPLITLRGAKARILRALNQDLGRSIHADAVHLRLFPLPGVELDGVRVGEDPAFGLEDMVIADDATAAVRLGPLFSGHLVFARIHLDRPSINLVRNQAGQWNISALLDRTSSALPHLHAAAAPPPSSPSPLPFPYIEWSDARLNFKLHEAKTRFYLDQVEGSLARTDAGWRLQARFQPQRSDLSLSDTGEVTLDGRWPATGQPAGFHQRPFDLVLRLQNSYLAGSSALLVGHDAGVHGILTAQVHVQGSGQQFQIVGTLQAQSLRRWDLLPPPATVNASFAAVYIPGQDRLDLEGVGDPGFHHIRLAGEVHNLFSAPSADLSLQLHQFAASDLIPLALAVKAHLPASLQAQGLADGSASLHWSSQPVPPASRLSGSAHYTLTQLRLASDRDQLAIPAAAVVWDGRYLRFNPAAATVASTTVVPPVPLQVAAGADAQGFQVALTSLDFTAAAAQALARLLGTRSPWPAGLSGSAQLHLALVSPWSAYRHAGFSGIATLAKASFRPDGGDFALSNVTVAFADPNPARVSFTTAPGGGLDGVSGWMQLASPTAPASFALHAARLRDAAVWQLLHPAPSDLVQRVFGEAPPAWITGLHAQGTLAVTDLEWQGMHTGLQMSLQAAPQLWQAPRLSLRLAHGVFEGSGRYAQGSYHITGAVPAAHPLQMAALLAPTSYRGLLSGDLTGALQLSRAVAASGMNQLAADGSFDLRRGELATAAGPRAFTRFSADYALQNGHAALSHVVWLAAGERWEGKGTADFDARGLAGFTLNLDAGARHLRLQAPPRRP